ncbi:MAG: TlpA family protein disulfide reductase [Bacteroidales bacterium]
MKKNVGALLWILLLFLGGLVLNSCKPKPPRVIEDVILSVNFTSTQGLNWIYLKELNVRDLKTIDSFDVRKTGRHTFRFAPDSPGLYIVQTKEYSFITLLLEPGERAELFADGKKMKKSYQVKGSPGSLVLQEYFIHTERNMMKIDSLREVFNKIKDTDQYPRKRLELDSSYYRVFREQKNFVSRLAQKNNTSIASLFIINQRFGPELLLHEKTDLDLFVELDSCLMAIYPENKHVLDHHSRISEIKRRQAEQKLAEERLKPGNPAPAIKLTTKDGQDINLSDLYGQTVLIYFWTAATAKARQDHSAMIPFYKQYKSKGLEIISVSLDENMELWQAALKVDRLPWIITHDQGGMKSPLARLFAVKADLPWFYVIDKKGNIVGNAGSFSEAKFMLLKQIP